MNTTIKQLTYENLMTRMLEIKPYVDKAEIARILDVNVETVRRAFRGGIKSVPTLKGFHDTANLLYSQTMPNKL